MASGVLRDISGNFSSLNTEEKAAAQQSIARGQALMAVGAGIAAVGAAGLVFLGKATAAAVNYNAQVALTKTQMYGIKASFDEVAQAGLDVATKIAVPLDQIQGGLYDIFSSMDVNMSQAKYLLTNFSKEAVAGQVDLSTAERASIGILNAYQMKVSQVTQVQDIMFNLVKYGVGTYADFANSIGRVTGPAVRANQTFQQTAALMAFTTRNGLSASQAASSVGRALDAISKSRPAMQKYGQIVVGALGDATAKKLGITANSMIKMTNAAGDLLPINQIMTELGSSLKNLNPTQLNDVLTAMFKGTGGTIQAMRFLDIAIKNYGQLNSITKEMSNSKGALQAAYNIMANTPAAKIQLLKNNFQALMIEIGNVLLPVLGDLAKVFSTLFSWIGKIPKPILTAIVIFGAVASIALVLTGIVIALVGAWIVFTVIMAASEVALLPIIITVLAVVAAIALLAVAAYEIYSHWGTISSFFVNLWNTVKKYTIQYWDDIVHAIEGAWAAVVNFFKPALNWVTTTWNRTWQGVYNFIAGIWNDIEGVFRGIENYVSSSFDKWWATHGESVKIIWNAIWTSASTSFKDFWNFVTGIAQTFWALISTDFKVWWDLISTIWSIAIDVIIGIFKIFWNELVTVAKIFGNVLALVFKVIWDAIALVAKVVWDIISTGFKVFWAVLVAVFKVLWATFALLWKIAWDTLVVIIDLVLDLITGHWHTAWVDILNYAHQIGNALAAWGVAFWHAIYGAWATIWSDLKGAWISFWHDIYNTGHTIANQFYSFGMSVWHNLESGWIGIWHSIYNASQSIWSDIKGGISKVWGDIVSGCKSTVSGLKTAWDALTGIFKQPIDWIIRYGYDDGLRSVWNGVMGAIGLSKWDLPSIKTLATGGRLSGYGGGDIVPALLEPGETVIDKQRSKKYASLFGMMGVRGYAGGGIVDTGKMVLAAATGNQTAFANAFAAAMSLKGAAGTGKLLDMAATLPVALAKKAISGVWHAITKGASSTPGIGGGPGGGNATANMALARQLMPSWASGSIWSDWMQLWTRESGWSQTAYNASSGATGIPQALPYTKMPKAGWLPSQGGSANPRAQETWGISYIKGRYGNPAGAWAHELAAGWYDNGGPLLPGFTLAYNGTGKTEWVSPNKGSGSSKGSGTEQNFYITTQEINPRYHAAQLGFEIARRSS
jgi:TP901 family phage tail tape measure protein